MLRNESLCPTYTVQTQKSSSKCNGLIFYFSPQGDSGVVTNTAKTAMADEESASLLGTGPVSRKAQEDSPHDSRSYTFVRTASVVAALMVVAVTMRQSGHTSATSTALDSSSYKTFSSGLDQDGWYLYKVRFVTICIIVQALGAVSYGSLGLCAIKSTPTHSYACSDGLVFAASSNVIRHATRRVLFQVERLLFFFILCSSSALFIGCTCTLVVRLRTRALITQKTSS